jgi:hypothetical protein
MSEQTFQNVSAATRMCRASGRVSSGRGRSRRFPWSKSKPHSLTNLSNPNFAGLRVFRQRMPFENNKIDAGQYH